MKTILLTISFVAICMSFALAQFAPQVGVSGSTAIHKSSTLIKGWATECTIRRGFQNIADKSSGYVLLGDSTNVFGVADGEIVSLGDSGSATVKFAQAIFNGAGPDFAVFENGFQNPANLEESFMELAFVEVSSDGENFFRFPATSNTPIAAQVKGVGEYMNARQVNNLAGKYIAQNGTPFDLEDLKGISGLDINNITTLRIIDVVGSISGHSSFDFAGNIINDPYPTAFATGGFDLDAVAAINMKGSSIAESKSYAAKIFPNPASDKIYIELDLQQAQSNELVLCDMSGRVLLRQAASQQNECSISDFARGIYLIGISNQSGIQWVGKCAKI